MQVTEQRYRKMIGEFRESLNNLISEYPIKAGQTHTLRNLNYILHKQSISTNLSYDDPIYHALIDTIKRDAINQNIQIRTLAIRLARALPFSHRITIIQQLQNQILKLLFPLKTTSDSPNKRLSFKQKTIQILQSKYQFSYEILADVIDLLLSVYEHTCFSQEIYFNVNQRIISILHRIIQNGYLSEESEVQRNMFECLRSIFYVFGPKKSKQNEQQHPNKLINKLVTYFAPNNTFVSKGANLSNLHGSSFMTQKSYSNKFFHLVLRTRQFEARIRSRFMYGLCCLSTYSEQRSQTIDLLIKEIFTILENANECDVNTECFNSIKTLINSKINFHTRTTLMKKWTSVVADISYKKEYLENFIALLNISSDVEYSFPLRLKFYVGMNFLEITRNVQQQFSRMIIYRLACKNIMGVNKVLSQQQSKSNVKNSVLNQSNMIISQEAKSKNRNPSKPSKQKTRSMIVLQIFQYSWFLDRINQQNDFFRSEFLISLLSTFFTVQKEYSRNEIKDLIGFCHRLLDWKCLTKEESLIPTIKFAFDMYLAFFKAASQVLGEEVERVVEELIQKSNQANNIYFLFRLKLISTIVSLPWYQQNHKFLSQVKFNFDHLDEEIRTTIMPKNSKPIFDFAYSQTADGLAESRKQIQFVKVIFQLLINLQKAHEEMNNLVESIQIDYHGFLNDLELAPTSNKDLIYCLQTATADQFFTVAQRNFLLSLIDEYDCRGNNFELNLDGNLLYSPYQTYQCEDEINIFGPMTPVQLTVKFHIHSSYSSVFLEVKKNNWVSTPKLKLLISSGMQKKEMIFESRIVEMKIDRMGEVHFQVWTAEGNELLIGSGNLKIKRKLRWRKVNYLGFIEGIKRKSYFKKAQSMSETECYLSYYYGQPVIVQIFRNCNQVIFGVTNKEVWSEMQSCLPDIIEEFTDGSADIFQ